MLCNQSRHRQAVLRKNNVVWVSLQTILLTLRIDHCLTFNQLFKGASSKDSFTEGSRTIFLVDESFPGHFSQNKDSSGFCGRVVYSFGFPYLEMETFYLNDGEYKNIFS